MNPAELILQLVCAVADKGYRADAEVGEATPRNVRRLHRLRGTLSPVEAAAVRRRLVLTEQALEEVADPKSSASEAEIRRLCRRVDWLRFVLSPVDGKRY